MAVFGCFLWGFSIFTNYCGSVSAHGAISRWIGPSWWTHWAISRSSQSSITGVTVCGLIHIKDPLQITIVEHPLMVR